MQKEGSRTWQNPRVSKTRQAVKFNGTCENRRPSGSKTVHAGGRPLASLINDNFGHLERVENSFNESLLLEN
jgi:hypothetical protein